MKVIKLKGYVGWDITSSYLERELPDDKSEAYIKVDSFGGSVYEGNRLYNTIFDYPGKITIELGAVAASAASYFPLAAGLKNIGVRKNTTFMGHKAWAFMLGNSDELREEADILDGFDKIIASIYSEYTKRSRDQMLTEMSNEIWLIGGQAVIDGGFASFMVEDTKEDDSSSLDDDAVDFALENKIIDKSVIRARIEEGKNKLREKGVTEDLKKWAACLDQEILTLKTGSAPLNAEENNNTEEFKDMDLMEFLKKNPEAKAEYDKKFNAAENASNAIVKKERENTFKKINLSGFKLPDDLKESIESGESMDCFLEREIEARNKKLNAAPDDEIGDLADDNQLPGEGEEAKLTSRFDKAAEKRLKKKIGGGN